MIAVARFISCVVQDRIVYASLATTNTEKVYVAVSRANIYIIPVTPDPRINPIRLSTLQRVIVDLNDETALRLEFVSAPAVTLYTPEREELLRELAVRYLTFQKCTKMISVDFPLHAQQGLEYSDKPSGIILGPRAPKGFSFLRLCSSFIIHSSMI
jgi:hypothetical protein